MSTKFTPVNEVADARADRKRRQAFYTPIPLVQKLVEWSGASEFSRCLEPSAGDGRIVHALRALGARVDACESDTTLHPRIEAAGGTIVGWDFLALTEGGYDVIVMNPPFRNRTWAAHIAHAWTLLGNNGKLLSVAPAEAARMVRDGELPLPGCTYATCEPLDAGLFREFGTNVKVAIVELRKGRDELVLGFTNHSTANAVLTIENDRELLTLWSTDRAGCERMALAEIAEGGGSTYGIHWREVHEHLESK